MRGKSEGSLFIGTLLELGGGGMWVWILGLLLFHALI